MSDLRVVGLRFEVDVGDGKTKIVQMRRAISDTTATVDRLNQELGDNVRVSTEKIQTDKEVIQQARLIVSQQERQHRIHKQLVESIRNEISTIGRSSSEQTVLNNLRRLGSNATSEQKEEVVRLSTEVTRLREQEEQLKQQELESIKVKQQKQKVYDTEKLAAEELINSLTREINLVGKSSVEIAAANTVTKLGSSVTSEYASKVKMLATQLEQLKQEEQQRVNAARLSAQEQERQRRKTAEVVKQYTNLNQTIKQYGNDFETVNAIVRLGSNATDQQKQQVAELVQEYQRLRNAGDKAGTGFRNLRGISQNLGWQLQDVAVQAQMGTSWFTIIAQQGSQFAGAFGPMGAMIGAGIAVGFALMPTVLEWLGKATASTKELEEANQKLNQVLNVSGYTVNGVTKQLYELYKIDSQLARLKLLGAMHDAETAMIGFNKGMEGMLDKTMMQVVRTQEMINKGILPGIPPELASEYESTLAMMGRGLDKHAEKLGVSRDELFSLGLAYKTFKETGDVSALTDQFAKISQDTSRLTPEFKKLVSEYAELAAKGELTKRQMAEIGQIMSGQIDVTDSYSGSVESLTDRYARMRRQLEMNERQITVDNFLRNEAKKLSEEEVELTVRAMNSYYDEKDAIEARNRAIETAKKLDDDRIKQRESLLKPIEQSLIISSDNPVIAEVERNKKVMDTLQAQMQNTKEYEYSERARINKLIQLEEEKHIEALTEAQFQLASNQVALIGQTGNFLNGLVNEMFDGGERVREQMEEMSGAQKAMFFLMRSIAAAEAVINGITLGSRLAVSLGWAAPTGVAFGAGIGAANAGAIMGATFAGAFDNGGYIPSGQWGIASEYGDELVNGVMVRGPADITSRVDTAAMTQGGLNVTVENYAPGVSHQVQQIDEKTVRIIATQVFNQNIDKGVSGVLGKKGTKANKTLTGNYDVRGRV